MNGRITAWTRQFGTDPSTFYGFQYDAVDQLVGAALTNGTPASPGTLIQKYASITMTPAPVIARP